MEFWYNSPPRKPAIRVDLSSTNGKAVGKISYPGILSISIPCIQITDEVGDMTPRNAMVAAVYASTMSGMPIYVTGSLKLWNAAWGTLLFKNSKPQTVASDLRSDQQ